MSEKLPVAWVAYASDPKRPGSSPMKDREIVPVIDMGDSVFRNHCVYMNEKIVVNDTPGDANWPNVELIVNGDEGLGWHGWYRAFSSHQEAEKWLDSRISK